MNRSPLPVRVVLAVILLAGVLALVVALSRSAADPHESASDGARPDASSASTSEESRELVAPAHATGAARANPVVDAAGSASADTTPAPLRVGVLVRKDAVSPEGLAGIRLAVGIGAAPLGDQPRSVLGQFALRAGLPLDAARTPYREIASDSTGRAHLEFSALEVAAARAIDDARVWVRVVEPGLQQRTYSRELPDANAAELTVFAMPGLTLRGRVVDEHGTSVAATVSARTFDFEGKLGMGATCWSGEDGWFELFPFQGGVQNLIADAEGHGTGVLRDVDLAAPPEPLVLVVRGPGIVHGIVLDDAGRAVPALDLGIWIPSIDTEDGGMAFPPHALDRAVLEGRGRPWATARTDSNGYFRAAGLRADTYLVRAGDGPEGPFPIRLTPEPVVSEGAPLELRLQRTYLAVKLVDERGQPWTDGVSLGDPNWWGGRDRATAGKVWPESTTIVVMRARSSALPGEYAEERIEGQRAGDEFVFVVPDDAHLRVGLVGGTQTWRPIDVDVPRFAGRVEVTVAASSADTRGTLSVVVRDFEGRTLNSLCSIRIEDVDDGAALVFDDLREEPGSPRTYRLPEGRYRVVVQGEPLIDGFHGIVWAGSNCGRVEELVDVRRGATTDLLAVLPVGARIQLALAGEISEAQRQAQRDQNPPGFDLRFLLDEHDAARTMLVREGRRPIPVRFPYFLRGSSAQGNHVGDWLALGTEATSEPLPAGRFELVARLADGREVRAPVELVDGVTTKLSLAFDAPK